MSGVEKEDERFDVVIQGQQQLTNMMAQLVQTIENFNISLEHPKIILVK